MGLQIKDLETQEASEYILAPLSFVPIKDTGLYSHGHQASPHYPLSRQFFGACPGATFVPIALFCVLDGERESHLPLHYPPSLGCMLLNVPGLLG